MRHQTSFRLSLVAGALSALLVAGCGQSPEQMLASAKEYLGKNDRPAAIIQLKNALQENPNLAEARLLLGKSQFQAGDIAAAEKELRKALELKVPIEQVAPSLAEVMLAQGEAKKVIEEFGAVQIPDPQGKAELQTSLGQAYLVTGNAEAATVAFAAALAAKPDFGRALLGQAYLKAGARDLPGALALAESAAAKDPKLIEARQLKGDLLLAQGQQDNAIAAYREALAVRPDYLAAHAAIIGQLAAQGKFDEATKQLEAMQKVAPKQPQTLYVKATLDYRQKNFAAAREAVQGVLQVAPDYLPGLVLSGAIDYELKSYAQAEASLTKVLQRAPNAGFARRVLAATYLRERQPAKALDTLKPLLEGAPTDAALASLAGEIYLQNGNIDEGARYFEMAARIDPKNTPTRTALALTHLAKGETDRAFRELEDTAATDTGIRADMALIAASMRKRDYDRALAAIDALEKKQPDNPLAQNLRGGVMLAKRDVAGARKNFEKALTIDKGYVPAAANLARLDIAEKKPDDAKKRFEAVLEKDPKNVQALLALAELRANAGGSADEVAGLIGKAIAANPKELTLRLALIGLYLKNQDTKKAIAAAQDGLSALPDNPELTHALGRAQQAAGDAEAALTTFNKLAQLQPNSPVPWLRIAEVQAQAKNNGAAVQSLRKALVIKPDLVEAQVALMRLEVADGRLKEALTVARDVQRQRPKEVVGFLLEGDVHMSQKAWKEAIAAYRAGLKVGPDATDGAAKLHAALGASGAAAEADRFATTWMKDHPKDVRFLRYRAEAAMVRRDYAGSLAYYRSALQIEPNNAMVLNNAAWTAAQVKDPKALEYAEQANKLLPNNAAIMDTLGNIVFDKGDTTRGLELMKKAVDGAPNSPGIRLNYARALVKAGQKDAAKKELEALQQLGDKFGGQAEVTKLMQGL
ncbi:MAG: PEP-CTERM system TPR-repeat protein PrsT [Betaproteobacteria bacterium]|nr:PEP-CTERM system TPR-repeat protein PrsT [Betaproteobacteria bacterium]